jgi:hypothetical protein
MRVLGGWSATLTQRELHYSTHRYIQRVERLDKKSVTSCINQAKPARSGRLPGR